MWTEKQIAANEHFELIMNADWMKLCLSVCVLRIFKSIEARTEHIAPFILYSPSNTDDFKIYKIVFTQIYRHTTVIHCQMCPHRRGKIMCKRHN